MYPYCIHCWSRPPLLKRGFGGLNFPWAKEPERSSTSRSVTYRMLSAAGLRVCVCIICLYMIFYILYIQYMCGILIYTILDIYIYSVCVAWHDFPNRNAEDQQNNKCGDPMGSSQSPKNGGLVLLNSSPKDRDMKLVRESLEYSQIKINKVAYLQQ